MKNPMNNFGLVPWLALFLCFSSCQDDFEKVGQEGPDGGILAHSPSAALIGRASAFDGSYDNVVDGAGCFAIKFPYTISLNGEAIDIRSKEDLLAIQEKLGLLIDGRAQLDLVFPVRLTLGDFSEILVENQEALARLALDCMEVGEDRIGCIEFIYPITLFTLEVESQRAGEATVDSDQEMRRFFAGLDPGLRVSLQFPVQLKEKDGSILEVGDITELTTALGQAEKACEPVKLLTKKALDAFLGACPFKVREVKRGKMDSSDPYFGSTLAFALDGTLVLTYGNGTVLKGQWNSAETDLGMQLILEFPDPTDFNLDWQVYRSGDRTLVLYRGQGDKIALKKWCDGISVD